MFVLLQKIITVSNVLMILHALLSVAEIFIYKQKA